MFNFLIELIGVWGEPDSHYPAIGRFLFGAVGAAFGAKFASYLTVDHWIYYAIMIAAAVVCFVLFATFWRKLFEKAGNS